MTEKGTVIINITKQEKIYQENGNLYKNINNSA